MGRTGADPFVDVVVLMAAVGCEVPRDVHQRLRPEGSGEDPYQGQFADVRLGGGLDDFCQQVVRRGHT